MVFGELSYVGRVSEILMIVIRGNKKDKVRRALSEAESTEQLQKAGDPMELGFTMATR